MLPRGRPPGPGTAEEKAAARREKVRLNVKAYRERKKKEFAASLEPEAVPSSRASSDSSRSGINPYSGSQADQDGHHRAQEENEVVENQSQALLPSHSRQVAYRAKPQTGVDSVAGFFAPDNGPIFSVAMLDGFRRAFIPAAIVLPSGPHNQDHPHLITPCSPWIIHAYNQALQQDSSALKSGLLAVGLIVSGVQYASSEMELASIQMHQQALRRLYKELGPIVSQRSKTLSISNIITPYLSCLAICMFEVLQKGFSPDIIKHVKAMNSLIEMIHEDQESDMFMADLIMEDFGMLEMMFCLKYGFSSILRNTRRKLQQRQLRTKGASQSRKNASVFGDMLDIAGELPSLIGQVRSLQKQSQLPITASKLYKFIDSLCDMQDELSAWTLQFEQRHGSIMVQESFADERSGARGSRLRLRSYEHGTVALFVFDFQNNAIDAAIDAIVFAIQTKSESLQESSILELVGPKAIVDDHQLTSLSNHLNEQRMKARKTVTQLVEVLDRFAKITHNISGRAMLSHPCAKAMEVLHKEQARLNEDLRTNSAQAFEIHENILRLKQVGAKLGNIELDARGTKLCVNIEQI